MGVKCTDSSVISSVFHWGAFHQCQPHRNSDQDWQVQMQETQPRGCHVLYACTSHEMWWAGFQQIQHWRGFPYIILVTGHSNTEINLGYSDGSNPRGPYKWRHFSGQNQKRGVFREMQQKQNFSNLRHGKTLTRWCLGVGAGQRRAQWKASVTRN